MRFFLWAMLVRFKLLLKPSFIFLLVVFPLSINMLAQAFKEEAGLRFGIVYEQSPLTEYVTGEFLSYVGDDAECVFFDNAGDLRKAASKQLIEFGYVISKDLDITLYTGPFSISHELFNIMLSSAVIQTQSGELGEAVLKSYFPEADNLKEDIQERANGYAARGPAMEMEVIALAGSGQAESLNEEAEHSTGLMSGLTALLGFLLALLYGTSFGEERGLIKQLRMTGRNSVLEYMLAFVCAGSFSVLIIFLLSMPFSQLWDNLGMIFSFSLASACFSMLLSCISGVNMIAAVPFLFLYNIGLGQVLFPIQEMAVFLKPFTRLTLTSYFMYGIAGSFPAVQTGLLLLISAACFGLSYWRACDF